MTAGSRFIEKERRSDMFRKLVDRLLKREKSSSRRELTRSRRRDAFLESLQSRIATEVASWTNAFRNIVKNEGRRRPASLQSSLLQSLQLEALEARLLLASDVVFTASPDAVNHTLSLDSSGNVQITEDGVVVLSEVLSEIDELLITGNDNDNTLLVDFVHGNPIPAGGLTYDGVNRGTDFDVLDFANAEVDAINGDFVNLHDGSIELVFGDGSQSMVQYLNIEPITSTINATNVTLSYGGSSETITVTQSAGNTTVSSTAGESSTFVTPSDTLTINAGGGNDIIRLGSGPSLLVGYVANIVVNGDAGADKVEIFPTLTLDFNKDLSIHAETIDLRSPTIIADDILFDGNVVLDNPGSINVDNNLIFTGTVNASPTGGLNINTALGKVEFQGALGNNTPLSGVVINNASDVIFSDVSVVPGGEVTVVSSTGTVTVGGDIVVTDNGGASGTVSLSTNRNIVLASGASITTVNGDIALNAAGTIGGTFDGISLDNAIISTSGAGSISVIGRAGAGGGVGVKIDGNSSVTATGSGEVTIDGIGGAAGTQNAGVQLTSGTNVVSTVGGDLTVTGTGGAGGTGGQQGVIMQGPSVMRTTNGTLEITGTATSANNEGVVITTLDVLGSGNVIVNSIGTTLKISGTIGGPTATGNVTLNTDAIDLTGGINSSGNLLIKPQTPTTSIGIGGGGGTLNLDDAELALLDNRLNSITIGDETNGTGTVSISDTSFANPVAIAGGDINVTGALTNQ
ncbi:MAG: hypothetical protein ACI9HK_002930, partial [Pirellulaceae bacterium]